MVVTLGQQYNVGEKPTVILYTYISRHAGTQKKKTSTNKSIVTHTTTKTSQKHCGAYVVVFKLKNRSDLYSVPSNIRTDPTDANAFRGHRLTTQKGTYFNMKNQKEIEGPRKKSTHTLIGNKQKNKAPDSQTSQATCRTKEIGRAYRSHSTREAKQNKTRIKDYQSRQQNRMILSLYPY